MASPGFQPNNTNHRSFFDHKLGQIVGIVVMVVVVVVCAIFMAVKCIKMVKVIRHNRSMARVASEPLEPPQGEAMHQDMHTSSQSIS
ncbi:hypothetical protein AAZX31_14G129500 [Glycine max]|nr:hypothetical protein D0Y65_038604 [Glycine soja]